MKIAILNLRVNLQESVLRVPIEELVGIRESSCYEAEGLDVETTSKTFENVNSVTFVEE